MKVAILTEHSVMGYVDLLFYDESPHGMTVYRPGQVGGTWESQTVTEGMAFPDDFRVPFDTRTVNAMADALNEQKYGTRQLDTTVLKTLEHEQARVDKLIDYVIGGADG